MRKYLLVPIILLSCLTITFSVFYIISIINYLPQGTPDQTSNINVMLNRNPNWQKIEGIEIIGDDESFLEIIDGSTATVPITLEILRQLYDYSDDKIFDNYYDFWGYQRTVIHNTTHQAYLNLINKDADLIFVTPPSIEELQIAADNNIELELIPIATDGFVFITHQDNKVNNLTQEQIQKIYTGEIRNWRDVGGDNGHIIAYQREPNSGSQTAMINMVMEGKRILNPILIRAIYGMGSLVDAVAEYDNSIRSLGYTYNYYINYLYKKDTIKTLSVNGVLPTDENFISKKYPFTTNYYAVIRKESGDSLAKQFVDLLVSDKGQELIKMAGYTGVR